MKKRSEIHLAIGLGAIALALVWPIHMEAKPMVECKDGLCVISEADWNRYREFHLETRKQMARIDEAVAEQNKAYLQLMGALNACQPKIPEREV